MTETRMKTVVFQRIATYDTHCGGDTIIDFPLELQWKMEIKYLRFMSLDGEVWNCPIGYLRIYSDASQFTGSSITNGDVKIRNVALPIAFPDQDGRQTAIGCFRGVSSRGPVAFHFSVLNSLKTKVELKRIVVVFSISAEDGK